MRCEAGSMPIVSERMHRMDARALRGKDASKSERPTKIWFSATSISVEHAYKWNACIDNL